MDEISFTDLEQFKQSIDSKREKLLSYDFAILGNDVKCIDIDTATEIPNGRVDFLYKGIVFECVFHFKKEKRLYVILNGSLEQEPPQFSRWSYYNMLDGCMLNVADPMYRIYDDLKLGWYYGNDKYDLRQYLVELVQKIAHILHINNKNIIFWGASGGGAATIECASRIKGAISVAINPQVVLAEYIYTSEFNKITGNDLESNDRWNRNNAIYYLKKRSKSFYILIFNVRSDIDMKQVKNICAEMKISLKYGLNVIQNCVIWLYDAECEPYKNAHCAQEYDCIVFIIEFLIKSDKRKLKNYDQLFRLVNEFWYYKWKQEKNLRNKMIDTKVLLLCHDTSKQVVLWGSGDIAAKLADGILDIDNENLYKICMVIDNNMRRKGQIFRKGIIIEHPSEILEWKKYFIIIALEKGCRDVEKQLKEKKLEYGEDYIFWRDLFKMCMY